MPKRHYKWDMPEDNEERARKHRAIRNFDYEAEDFINTLYDLAAMGYYDYEIAKKVGIDAVTFCEKCSEYPIMRESLAKGREKTAKMGSEKPSLAYFRELVAECEGKTSRILKQLGVGYKTYRRWLAEDPSLQMEVDMQNLIFLEKLDAVGRLCATGVLIQLDEDGNDVTRFPGFKVFPNSQLLMFYMNSVGAKYGYSGKEEIMGMLESAESADRENSASEGVDISRWIEKEIEEKSRIRAKEAENVVSDESADVS